MRPTPPGGPHLFNPSFNKTRFRSVNEYAGHRYLHSGKFTRRSVMSDSTDREKRPGRRDDGPRFDGARSASAHPRASKPRQAGGTERKLWTSDGKPARSAAPGARDQQRGGRRDE